MLGAVVAFRAGGRGVVRRLLVDAAGLLTGALAIAALVIGWLVHSGNWPYFAEGALGGWNQDYYGSSPSWPSRCYKLFYWLWPWSLVHLLAVPVALFSIGRALSAGRRARPNQAAPALLGAFYLGWFVQANFMQRQLVYQVVPCVILGITMLASGRWLRAGLIVVARKRWLRWLVATTLLALMLPLAAVCLDYWLDTEYLGTLQKQVEAGFWSSFVEADDILIFVRGMPTLFEFALILLLILVVASASQSILRHVTRVVRWRRLRWLALAVFLWLAVAHIPLLNIHRLALWGRCVREGSSPEIRHGLALERDVAGADWVALDRVERYLHGEGVRGRDVTCYAVSAIPLYQQLGLDSSTRFVLLWPALIYFPSHGEDIALELGRSPQRFVVNDLRQMRIDLPAAQFSGQVPDQPLALPPPFPPYPTANMKRYFPWGYPVVFREGRYVVHRLPEKHRPVQLLQIGAYRRPIALPAQ
jgi:hypothetical protein